MSADTLYYLPNDPSSWHVKPRTVKESLLDEKWLGVEMGSDGKLCRYTPFLCWRSHSSLMFTEL